MPAVSQGYLKDTEAVKWSTGSETELVCEACPDVEFNHSENKRFTGQVRELSKMSDNIFTTIDTDDLSCLKWLRELGCHWDYGVLRHAIRHGRIEILQWLLTDKCCYSGGAMGFAMDFDRLDVIKWLVENGYNQGGSAELDMAAAVENHEAISWMLEHGGYRWHHTELAEAVREGDLDRAECMMKHGVTLSDPDIMTEMIDEGNLEAVQWLKEHDYPCDKSMIIYAIEQERPEIAIWMIRNCFP